MEYEKKLTLYMILPRQKSPRWSGAKNSTSSPGRFSSIREVSEFFTELGATIGKHLKMEKAGAVYESSRYIELDNESRLILQTYKRDSSPIPTLNLDQLSQYLDDMQTKFSVDITLSSHISLHPHGGANEPEFT